MRTKASGKDSQKRAADLRTFRDFSSGSKIQDAIMALLLKDSTSEWLPRKNIVNRLVERGALRRTTSSEVGRIQVQKALDALDKKLAQVNEDRGTSWVIERRKGKGLRLIQQHEGQIANRSTLEARIQKLEERIAELEPSEDTQGLTQIAFIKRILKMIVGPQEITKPAVTRMIEPEDPDEPVKSTPAQSTAQSRLRQR